MGGFPPNEFHRVLQDKRDTCRGKDPCQGATGTAHSKAIQRAYCETFKPPAHEAQDDDDRHDDNRQGKPGTDCRKRQKRSRHQEIALPKIHTIGGEMRNKEPFGRQGVNGAHCHAGHKQLDKIRQGHSPMVPR